MEFSCVCMFYSENDICLPKRRDYSADYSFKKKNLQDHSKNLQVFLFFKGEPKCQEKKKRHTMRIKWNNRNNGKKLILKVCRLTLNFLSRAQLMYILITWFSSASSSTWPCQGSSIYASPLISWNLNRNMNESHNKTNNKEHGRASPIR